MIHMSEKDGLLGEVVEALGAEREELEKLGVQMPSKNWDAAIAAGVAAAKDPGVIKAKAKGLEQAAAGQQPSEPGPSTK